MHTTIQYYFISCKNIKMQGLGLAKLDPPLSRSMPDGMEKRVYIQDNWEELCAISQEHVDSAVASDILNLPLNHFFMKGYPAGSTVKTVVDNAVEELGYKYVPSLQKEFGVDNVHFWVLVRVGIKRIIAQQVSFPGL